MFLQTASLEHTACQTKSVENCNEPNSYTPSLLVSAWDTETSLKNYKILSYNSLDHVKGSRKNRTTKKLLGASTSKTTKQTHVEGFSCSLSGSRFPNGQHYSSLWNSIAKYEVLRCSLQFLFEI